MNPSPVPDRDPPPTADATSGRAVPPSSWAEARAYFSTLWRLWRERRDNPIIYHAHPMRRSWSRRVAYVLFWTLPIVLAALFMGTLRDLQWDFADYFAATCLITAGAMPLIVVGFALDWRDEARLAELRLTRLSKAEVAFGAVFWPVCLCLAMIAILLVLLLLLIPTRTQWTSINGVLLPIWIWSFMSLVYLCRTVLSWFRVQRFHWLVLIRAPIVLIGELFKTAITTFAWGFACEVFGRPFMDDEARFLVFLVPFGVALVLWTARTAGRTAGEAYFAPLAPDDYVRVHWMALEARTFQTPQAEKPGGRALFAIWWRRFGRDLALSVLVTGAALFPLLIRGKLQEFREFEWVLFLWMGLAMASTVVMLDRGRWRRNDRIPAVAGRALHTLFLYALAPLLVFVVAGSGLLIRDLLLTDHHAGLRWHEAILAGSVYVLPATTLVAFTPVLWFLPATRRFATGVSALAAAVVVLAHLWFYFPGEKGLAGPLVLFATAALSLEPMLWRYHRLEQMGVAPGHLTVERKGG